MQKALDKNEKMCGKALKTRLIFRGRTNEEHGRSVERKTVIHNRSNGGAPGAVRKEPGQGFYPAAVADTAHADQPHPDNGYFQNGIGTPSASAFVQQRKKLLPQAFEDLFHRFTDTLTAGKRFQGYRLLAVDGTSLKSMSYPEDSDAYRPGTQRQHGWNLYHLNALFDLENGIYTDVLVQKEHTKSEDAALCEMVGRSAESEPVILLEVSDPPQGSEPDIRLRGHAARPARIRPAGAYHLGTADPAAVGAAGHPHTGSVLPPPQQRAL